MNDRMLIKYNVRVVIFIAILLLTVTMVGCGKSEKIKDYIAYVNENSYFGPAKMGDFEEDILTNPDIDLAIMEVEGNTKDAYRHDYFDRINNCEYSIKNTGYYPNQIYWIIIYNSEHNAFGVSPGIKVTDAREILEKAGFLDITGDYFTKEDIIISFLQGDPWDTIGGVEIRVKNYYDN